MSSSIDISRSSRTAFGQDGARREAGTTARTGNWSAIQCLTETTFTTLTGYSLDGTWTGVAFPAGTVIYGNFTAFTLTSGSVIAYNAPA
jgi:hypothetical protein